MNGVVWAVQEGTGGRPSLCVLTFVKVHVSFAGAVL